MQSNSNLMWSKHTLSLTSVIASRVSSAMMGAVPLVQKNLRNEPLAEQVRTTVLLNSTISDTLALMVTFDTGSAGRNKVIWMVKWLWMVQYMALTLPGLVVLLLCTVYSLFGQIKSVRHYQPLSLTSVDIWQKETVHLVVLRLHHQRI